jgi:hypothetical protein
MTIKKTICFITLSFICLACIVAEDDYNFENKNINSENLKTIELRIPNFDTKMQANQIDAYLIKIDSDGIIRSILYNNNIEICTVYKNGNLINLKDKSENIINIKYDKDNIYIRGVSYFTKNTIDFSHIIINPSKGIVYESPIKKLLQNSNSSLEEVNTDRRTMYVFANNINTIDFDKKGNHLYKYEFFKKDSIIKATYYYNMEDESYIKYTPDIEIKLNDVNLFSKEEVINVLNYVILYTLNNPPEIDKILDVLFPMIFLEDWYTQNIKWQYTASSYLKEKNAIYEPNNLSEQNGLPWVSANGYGIGEKIIIDMAATPSNKLLLINGFVSKENPNFFNYNSRLQQAKITNTNTKKSKIISVRDTANSQDIDISDLTPDKNTKIEIEILSVFPGVKYKDLCIQAILPVQ